MKFIKFMLDEAGYYLRILNNDEDMYVLGHLITNCGNCGGWLQRALSDKSVTATGANSLDVDFEGEDAYIKDQFEWNRDLYLVRIKRDVLLDIVNKWEELEHKKVAAIWIVQDEAGNYYVTDKDPLNKE